MPATITPTTSAAASFTIRASRYMSSGYLRRASGMRAARVAYACLPTSPPGYDAGTMRPIRRLEREEAIRTAPMALRIAPLLYLPVPLLLGFGLFGHQWLLGAVLAGLSLPVAAAPWDRVLVWLRRRRLRE